MTAADTSVAETVAALNELDELRPGARNVIMGVVRDYLAGRLTAQAAGDLVAEIDRRWLEHFGVEREGAQ